MRGFMIGLGVAAMVVAAVLATRDNTAHVNTDPVAVVHPTAAVLPKPTPTRSPGELFFVRDQDSYVAYDLTSGQAAFKLPRGLPSADQKHYYASVVEGDNTALQVFDLQTGSLIRSFALDGQWLLSGVSADGRWLGLQKIATDREMNIWGKAHIWKTRIEILGSADGTVAHQVNLDGNFDIDALSAAGDSLFLIEHIPALDSKQYSIRLYDLATNELQPAGLVTKGESEVMVGQAWSRLASPDGRWLLTLYLNTANGTAFIHALDLEHKFAHCIDLPSGNGNLESLKLYSLALSPDGWTAYAANPALGVVAQADLTKAEIVRTDQFAPRVAGQGIASNSYVPNAQSVMSSDGQRLFFADHDEIWAFDTRAGKVTDNYRLSTEIYGLGMNPGGNRLDAATPTSSARVFIVPSNGTLVPLALAGNR
jgi:hypothetical protein